MYYELNGKHLKVYKHSYTDFVGDFLLELQKTRQLSKPVNDFKYRYMGCRNAELCDAGIRFSGSEVTDVYEPPIEISPTEWKIDFDKQVYHAVVSCGVNVDKDELVKALRYDRNQYEKGYQDGVEAFALAVGKEFSQSFAALTRIGEILVAASKGHLMPGAAIKKIHKTLEDVRYDSEYRFETKLEKMTKELWG